MKKILSVALSLVLVITAVITPLITVSADTTYFYLKHDFESKTDVSGFMGSSNVTVSLDTAGKVVGNNSLKVTAAASGQTAVNLYDKNADHGTFNSYNNTNLRISGKYRLETGETTKVRVGACAPNNGYLNSSGVLDQTTAGKYYEVETATASDTIKEFTGTVQKSSGYFAMGIMSKAGYTIYIDEIAFAQLVNTVSASADSTKGTATVKNANEKFTDFAVNETAIFTAKPNEGYEFVNWTDSTGKAVSTDLVYNHTVTTDVTLTANFKALAKSYFYLKHNFESNSDVSGFIGSSNVTVSLDTASKVVDNNSLKVTAAASGQTAVNLYDKNVDHSNIKNNTNLRISGKYRLESGETTNVRVGKCTPEGDGSVLNASAAFSAAAGMYYGVDTATASEAIIEFSGTAQKNGGYYAMGIMSKAGYTIYIDEVTFAEFIDSVTATSENEEKGTAKVENANEAFTNFAVNETAIFTATPKTGYVFEGWYNANGMVSDNAVYETKVTTDTTLTAKFKEGSVIKYETNGGEVLADKECELDSTVYFSDLATPTKENYKFVGWYTDEGLTTPFVSYTFNTVETVTLYARYRYCEIQDFENYTATKTQGTIVDGEGIDGSKALRCDPVEGSNNMVGFYVFEHMIPLGNYKVTVNVRQDGENGKNGLQGFLTNNVATPSGGAGCTGDSWIEGVATDGEWHALVNSNFSFNYDSRVQSHFLLKAYPNRNKNSTEPMYIDNIMVEEIVETVNLDATTTYVDETIKLQAVEGDMSAAITNALISFKALCDEDITPVITYGSETVTSVNGVYTVVADADKALTVDGTGTLSEERDHARGEYKGNTLTAYDKNTANINIWDGDVVYHEPVFFYDTTKAENDVAKKDGTTKKLVYPINEIISVRSADLKTVYVKGVDFDVVDGEIKWLETGDIPLYTGPLVVNHSTTTESYGTYSYANFYYAANQAATATNDHKTGAFTIWEGNHEQYTVYVTYKKDGNWNDVNITEPKGQGYGWNHTAVVQGKVGFFQSIAFHCYNEGGSFDNVVGGSGSVQAVPMAGPKGSTAYIPTRAKVWGVAKNAKNPEGAAYFLRYWLDVNNCDFSSTFYNKQMETVYNIVTNPNAKRSIMNSYGLLENVKSGLHETFTKKIYATAPANVVAVIDSQKGMINQAIEKANKQLASVK